MIWKGQKGLKEAAGAICRRDTKEKVETGLSYGPGGGGSGEEGFSRKNTRLLW